MHNYSIAPVLAVSLLIGSAALADDLTWNLPSDGDWDTTTANWSSGPTTFTDGGVDNVTFNGAGGGVITVTQGMSPLSTTVDSAGTYKFITGVTPQGQTGSIDSGTLIKNGVGTLQLGDDLLGQQFGGSANIYSNGFTSVTVNGGKLLLHSLDAAGTGTITMAGGTTLSQNRVEGRYETNNEDFANNIVLSGGSVTVDFAPKGMWLAGDISGSGGIMADGGNGGRGLALSGENTFGGGVTLVGKGGLNIGSYSALGTGTFTANQIFGNTGGGLVGAENLDGTAADKQGLVDAAGVDNNINILSGGYFNVTTTGTELLLSGDISGAGTLNRNREYRSNPNGGVVRVTGTLSHTGGTMVLSDILRIDGTLENANITISTSTNSGPVDTSEVSPGTVDGSGTIIFNINGATNDLIQVLGYNNPTFGLQTGTLDITGLNLAFNVFGAGLTEDFYVLVDTAVDGEEAGLVVGTEFASVSSLPTGYSLDYNYGGGTQIALVVIPEPSVLTLGGLSLLALLRRRQR